jgi:uncharacterized membrane protein
MDRKWVKWVALLTVVAFFATMFMGIGYTVFFGK